ncbi:hypothetical protein ACFPRL_06470 [Pseudoclavibacter helvolus]
MRLPPLSLLGSWTRLPEPRHPSGSRFLGIVQESARGGLDERLPLCERGPHVVCDWLGRCRDESGDSCPASFTWPEFLGGLVEHVGQLRGGVGLFVAGREPRCESGECRRCEMAGCLVTCECALQLLVVGAGEQVVGHVLGERRDVE